MIYEDKLYGKHKIDQPVVLELIRSQALQRLKGIDQAGYWKPFFPGRPFSRFEHSIGVYLLLRKYNTPLEEQIAGLIHDVSHSSFSHCIDYALKEGSQARHDHQDNVFINFVRQSTIPKILKKYKLNLDYILEESNFPLKEKDIPDLCADRIDYSLRTAVRIGEVNRTWVDSLLKSLEVLNNQWVFEDRKSAEKFARLFYKLNKKYYAGFSSALMFSTVGDWLAYALSNRYIRYNQLYTTDKFVIQKISKYNKLDKKLALFWKRMNNKVTTRNNSKVFDKKVIVKSRITDPLFLDSKKRILRFSQVEKKWQSIVKRELQPKKYYLKFGKEKKD